MSNEIQNVKNKRPAGTVEKASYESPSLQCQSLVLITLGGTPGAGDSGDPNNMEPNSGDGNQTEPNFQEFKGSP